MLLTSGGVLELFLPKLFRRNVYYFRGNAIVGRYSFGDGLPLR
jgi:hypothetical protein